MKKITLTLLLALTIQLGWTQCNELYISEIFYGEVDESDNFKNFSIEIFNPKDVSVDLTDYKLKFTAVGKTDYFIDLTGTMTNKGKFVVTLATSEGALSLISDMISSSFDYYNYEKIYFEKNGVIIDHFGKDSVTSANYDDFDITTFLTDPNYLATLNLNLQSLEDIDLRRNPLKTEGDLTWNGLVDNWYPYTTANFNNIGEHQGICSGDNVVGWALDHQTVPENIGDANLDVNVTGDWVSSSVGFDYYTISGYQELDGSDLSKSWSSTVLLDFLSSTEYSVTVGYVYDDNNVENQPEADLVILQPTFNTTINPSKTEIIFEVIDNDNTTSIIDGHLKELLNVYPLVFN